MRSREKELGIKKVRINLSGCLKKCKQGPIIVFYSEENCYKILSKEDINLFIEELFVKRENIKKNLVEN